MREAELFYDYASPWAYLACSLLDAKMPGVPIVFRPVYLRGFDSFATGIPYGQAKLLYVARDFERCARHEGVRVSMPSHFPINGIYALRGAIAAQKLGVFDRYHLPIFHAAWRDDVSVNTKDAVVGIAKDLGLHAVADEIDAPWVKDALKEQTKAAVDRGLFGVPTFAIGAEIFWGHDRMEYAAREAARPRA